MASSRKNTRKKSRMSEKSGFTIIEVVLVLAIAGLIFLMVFIALPTLQRSQRDTQRRNDLGRVSTQLTSYQSNNGGKLPEDGASKEPSDDTTFGCTEVSASGTGAKKADCFIRNYMNSVNASENEFVDPDGTTYGIDINNYDSGKSYASKFDHVIYVVKKAKCDGETVTNSTNARDFAITYKLEGNGTYCADNGS